MFRQIAMAVHLRVRHTATMVRVSGMTVIQTIFR